MAEGGELRLQVDALPGISQDDHFEEDLLLGRHGCSGRVERRLVQDGRREALGSGSAGRLLDAMRKLIGGRSGRWKEIDELVAGNRKS